jgi:S1-C subfamily serine protease
VYIPDMEGDNYGEDDYNSNFTFTGRIGAEKYNTEITLVGGDATSDVALLKLNIKGSGITKDNLVKASFTTSTYSPRVGEDVFAIGNPTGLLPGTVSCGTISYINRSANVSEIGEMTLLQLDIDTYHGSSGGALFNL